MAQEGKTDWQAIITDRTERCEHVDVCAGSCVAIKDIDNPDFISAEFDAKTTSLVIKSIHNGVITNFFDPSRIDRIQSKDCKKPKVEVKSSKKY